MTWLRPRIARLALPLAIAIVLTGCSASTPVVEQPTRPAPHENQSASAPIHPPTASAATAPTEPPAANNVTAAPGAYLINQRARSKSSSPFEAVLYRATLANNGLSLRFGVQNMGDEPRYLGMGLTAKELRLVDSAGNEYHPTAVSANLEQFSLKDGYLPGQANVGEVTFPIPTAGGPFTLQAPAFEPITFMLDRLASAAELTVPNGEYPLDVALYSSHAALVPLRLQIERITVTSEEIVFAVAFANTGRRPLGISSDLNGNDSRMLDAEGVVYKPLRMSDSLRDGITPAGGLMPGQRYRGEIAFARPQPIEQIRFFFPRYTTATLTFNERGLASTAVTSATGGAPPPMATPTVEEQALQTLEKLLNRQAQAVMAGDLAGYLNTFASDVQPAQAAIFERSRQLPLADYRLALAPNTFFVESEWERGEKPLVTVNISYRWRGLPAENVFQHTLTYWFSRQDDRWVVSRYAVDRPAPFWWLDDVQVAESEHFLIFYRPAAADLANTVAAECAQVYAELQAAGLRLDSRFAVYVMVDPDDFREQTGQGARTLGLAIWNYFLLDERVQTQGWAFYLNGDSLTERDAVDNPFGRKATIKHEMVHLALARETMPFTPAWLIEGTAMYFAGQYRPELRQYLIREGEPDQISLAQLTAADQLGQFDFIGGSAGPEYLFSAAVVQYLIDTYGSERFWDFYRSFTHVPAERLRQALPLFSVMGSGLGAFRSEIVPEMLNAVYGLNLAELEAAVKAGLQQ
ncbi:hypothetical protein [Chloroflexus sp.]|uniref:hypothetical protein n=1 Tax=Chloroflexus sp. TaxID=1904827 RepID=UPI002ACD6AFC|nr:hypothetical protein [Chloroflexus sp.]